MTTSEFDTDRRMEMQHWTGSQTTASGSKYSQRTNVSSSYSSLAIKQPNGEAERVMKTMMGTIDKERKDLDDLNLKLANYIVNVKSKEATNKRLVVEIEQLKQEFVHTQTRVREEYRKEIEEARAKISKLSDGIAPLKAQLMSRQDKLDFKDEEIMVLKKEQEDLQIHIQKKDRMIGDIEEECARLRNQLLSIKQDNKRIRNDNDRIRSDQEAALTKQIKAQNECDTLAEEMQFLQETSQAEIRELRGLLSTFQFVQPNLEEVYKAEFKECIKAIQTEYNNQLAKLSTEHKGIYEVQNKRLETELAELRTRYEEECAFSERERLELQRRISEQSAEIKTVMSSLSNVRADNLDVEISCYRTLLDENLGFRKQDTVDGPQEQKKNVQGASGVVRTTTSSVSHVAVSESVEYVRVSTPLAIKEIDQSGSFVKLLNSSKTEDIELSNWNIERTHPKGVASFKIPQGVKLGPEKEVKVFSSNSADKKGPNDLVATCKTWGAGNGKVSITDDKGVEVITSTISFKGK